MKSMLRNIDDHGVHYQALMFVCPGCVTMLGNGLHMLPVNSEVKSPSWDWNGDLESPTLSPSILTGRGSSNVCHSFLTNGIFQFLSDCTHPLAGTSAAMVDLPDWIVNDRQGDSDE